MSRHNQKISRVVKIGTRGSPLALAQTKIVSKLIKKSFPSIKVQVVAIKTTGDRFQKPLYKAGEKTSSCYRHKYSGKGFFVKEIEEALVSGRIDLAVHSLKDVPASIPRQLTLCAFLKREDPRDLFISLKYKSLSEMPFGAKMGTSSPRRAAEVLIQRPDIKIIPIRGNVATRIKKLKMGLCDALILAAAGLKRLDLTNRLHPQGVRSVDFVHAVGQGIISVEARKGDKELIDIVRKSANDPKTEKMAMAERSFLETLTGDCHTPIAASAALVRGKIRLNGFVSTPLGRKYIDDSILGKDPRALGKKLGEKFIRLGARRLINLKNEKIKFISTGLNPLKHEGADVVHIPLIEIKPPSDSYRALDRAIKSIQGFDWVIFTSKNGARLFFDRLGRNTLPKKIKIAAAGEATAEVVKQHGRLINLIPDSGSGSEEMIRLFSRVNLKGKKILFPRAEDGLDILPRYFKGHGAKTTLVPTYKTAAKKIRMGYLKKVILLKRPDLILFQSPSAARSFYDNIGKFKIPKDIRLIGIGRTTQKAIGSYSSFSSPGF